MEDSVAVEELIRELERSIPLYLEDTPRLRKRIERLRLFGLDPGVPHIRAAPIFELFSVSVHSTHEIVANGRPCWVYGVIGVFDEVEDDNIYVLYDRRRSDPEELLLGDKLALDGYPFSPSKPLKVFVYLRDAARDVQIVNGIFSLEYKSERDYDVPKIERVDGEFGSAVVRHNTFKSAFVASVQVQVIKLKYDGKDVVNVYGNISAYFGENYSDKMGDDMTEDYFLFKKGPEKFVTVRSSQMIKLSRSRVAVPAYSSVWFVVELYEAHTRTKIAVAEVDFYAAERGTNTRDIVVKDYRTVVEVKWRHPDELFDKEVNKLDMAPIENFGSSLSMPSMDKKAIGKNMTKSLPPSLSSCFESIKYSVEREQEQSKTQELLLLANDPASMCSIASRPPLAMNKPLIGVPLVEVFSVVVDCAKHDSMGIYGTIQVNDNLGTISIFKRDDKHPEIFSQPCKTISIEGSARSFICEDFRLGVNLKDVKGRPVSKGFMDWDKINLKGYISWYDRHLCSIIEGDFGYAAVHYTIFSSGAQAALKVLMSNSSVEVGAKVYGTVTAQYSNYDYSTYYDSEFYQNVLFKEPLEKPKHLNGGSEVPLPLSKCVISAPLDSSLTIKIDLTVLPVMVSGEDINAGDSGINGGGVVQDVLDFKAFYNDSRRIQATNGYYVTVCTEWSGVDSVGARPSA